MTYDSLFDIYPLKEIGLDMIPQWLYFKWKPHSSLGGDYSRGTWKVKVNSTSKHILEEVKTKESHMQVMADIMWKQELSVKMSYKLSERKQNHGIRNVLSVIKIEHVLFHISPGVLCFFPFAWHAYFAIFS